jgi:hypothetical protein
MESKFISWEMKGDFKYQKNNILAGQFKLTRQAEKFACNIITQVSLGAAETIRRGKHLFERDAGTCGVTIRNYRGDNGVYKSDEFIKDLNNRNRMI